MNHHHRKILHSIFVHPISNNIDLKDIVHVFTDLGAEIDNRTGSRIGVTLNGHTAAFHHSSHDLPKTEVIQIRKFLETCGISPEKFPL